MSIVPNKSHKNGKLMQNSVSALKLKCPILHTERYMEMLAQISYRITELGSTLGGLTCYWCYAVSESGWQCFFSKSTTQTFSLKFEYNFIFQTQVKWQRKCPWPWLYILNPEHHNPAFLQWSGFIPDKQKVNQTPIKTNSIANLIHLTTNFIWLEHARCSFGFAPWSTATA